MKHKMAKEEFPTSSESRGFRGFLKTLSPSGKAEKVHEAAREQARLYLLALIIEFEMPISLQTTNIEYTPKHLSDTDVPTTTKVMPCVSGKPYGRAVVTDQQYRYAFRLHWATTNPPAIANIEITTATKDERGSTHAIGRFNHVNLASETRIYSHAANILMQQLQGKLGGETKGPKD